MAKSLYFSRDSKLYVEFDGAVWQVPVLDGFSFSQSTNTSEITLSEMQDSSGLSRRGRRVFTDSLAPVEWSFSTYVRPYKDNNQHSAVEAVLWAVMAGSDKYTGTSAGGISITTISTNIDGGVPGVYTGVTATSTTGGGTGATFIVTVASNGSATVAVSSPGAAYTASSQLTFDGDLFGDSTGNLVVEVDGVTDATRDFVRITNTDTNDSQVGQVFTSGSTKADLTFAQSNRSVLGTCNLYFVMATNPSKPMVYKLTSTAINEASLDFEVDGIATINWSGNGATIVDMQSAGHVSADTVANRGAAAANKIHYDTATGNVSFALGSTPAWTDAITTATQATSNFIRNRLTQLLITAGDTTTFPGSGSGVYNLTITGGNITITNNITYLTPEELGKVNVPIEHVTGARSITGSFTSYLTFDDTNSNAGTSSDFFNDLTSTNALNKVVNDFDVTFQVGGNVTDQPKLYIKIPKCHIEVPNHAIEDVISIETNFSAYTTDFSIADEVALEYYGTTFT